MSADVVSIVAGIKKMASIPENRAALAQDRTIVSGLGTFLENDSSEVIALTLECLLLLVSEMASRDVLAHEPGMVEKVKRQMIYGQPSCKKIASQLYTTLQPHLFRPTPSEPAPLAEPSSDGQQRQPLQAQNGTDGAKPVMKVGLSLFSERVCNSAGTARTHVLYVKNLSDEASKSKLEKTLLSTKGVVSFMSSIETHSVTVRALLSAAELIAALKAHGVAASSTDEGGKENSDPDYLPDTRPGERSGSGWFGLGSIVAFGEKRKEKAKSSGWGFGFF
eukprot:TRINITY_DN4169_c0_g1_i1.p1 TRINITY_DN4169_c0_g1~~TRINITY_DN4169_c0_g1_i1.p1  ORF type:complete len:278 (+),score=77.60 TRINITY_DN4169_c0_g1_i1:106-939(+)